MDVLIGETDELFKLRDLIQMEATWPMDKSACALGYHAGWLAGHIEADREMPMTSLDELASFFE